MIRSKTVLLILIVILQASCQKDKTRYTASGMKYILHSEHKGKKPSLGDYVTFEMVYKTQEDSVLFDSRENQSTFRIQLVQIPFKGSMEEGLTYLSEGDSATFFVSADSLRKNIFSKSGSAQGLTSVLKPGSLARFDIRLLRVQTRADAEKEIVSALLIKKEDENRLITAYLQQHNISVNPDSNGIYILTPELTRDRIGDGDTVSIYYESRYLDGIIFDSNRNSSRQYTFVVGSREVIEGWNISFKKLDVHAKATLLVPSRRAYGERGLLSAANGTYLVPPFTPLVYDIEVVAVRRGK